jgi:hypothetical protein
MSFPRKRESKNGTLALRAWIPASAGMTTKNHAFLMFVSPAKAGVQFGAFKKNPPSDDVLTIMDSLVNGG